MAREGGHRKILVGTVVSDRMQKTVVVSISRLFKHPTYNKQIGRQTNVKAHDEKNECRIGDRVRVMETRPLSRGKRWLVVEVLQRAV
ncbi:MAG: 30S ribosomal protein S17 [Candidatus Methylomirabilales bacterium]